MFRLTIASVLGLIAAVAANAGSVLIGGSTGLSSNYISQGAGAVCAAGAGNCITGSTVGWGEKNFDAILFAGATSGGTSPVPFAGYAQTGGTPSGLTASDTVNSSVSFAMISDGVNANNQSNNYWQSTGTGVTAPTTDTMVIPVGVFNVMDVRTMLDNQFGTLGGNDTTVSFAFGSTSNATSGLSIITVALNNVNNAGTGELRAAVSCTAGTSICLSAGPNPKSNPVTTVINGVTVSEGLVYNTFSYDTIPGSQPFYTGFGVVGKVKLDDQEFAFNNPALANLWLVSMTVTENAANTYASNNSAPSETALSAITVDTAAVPEPGTILLLMSSLGGLGLMRFRRRRG